MSRASKQVIFAALAGNTLIAITKFIAAAISGSSAMLSEGIHSLVDTGNQGLLLYGLRQARKPPNPRFPFGHGKEIYFWSFVVAILIFALGSGISLYEGILHILHPEPMGSPLINYTVIGLALLFEGAAWLFALREFSRVKGDRSTIQAVRRSKDPTSFLVLFEDSAALAGLLAALFGVWLAQLTGDPRFDGAASIVIGLILAATAIWLAYETKGLLIGESAAADVVDGVRRLTAAHSAVNQVNEVLTMHMGPHFILVNLAVDFRDNLRAGELESAIAELDRCIKQDFADVKRVFIEAESGRQPTALPG
jgi:cation diffusion facilitator family transporter